MWSEIAETLDDTFTSVRKSEAWLTSFEWLKERRSEMCSNYGKRGHIRAKCTKLYEDWPKDAMDHKVRSLAEKRYSQTPGRRKVNCFICNTGGNRSKYCTTNIGLPLEAAGWRKPRCNKFGNVGNRSR